LHIYLKELVTTDIIQQLKTGDLDAALLATPLNESMLNEHHLFNEEFLAYAATKDALHKKKLLLPNQIDPAKLWLLEEGHCLRTQVLNLCELKKSDAGERFHYEAGSIETLINLVDKYEGITIIPELALLNMKPHQKAKVLRFAPPAPVREISLVTHETYPRKAIIQAIKAEVAKALPFKDHTSGKILEITN
jgi:LysR family hydrogen peroxide-inducible transcriptional activator